MKSNHYIDYDSDPTAHKHHDNEPATIVANTHKGMAREEFNELLINATMPDQLQLHLEHTGLIAPDDHRNSSDIHDLPPFLHAKRGTCVNWKAEHRAKQIYQGHASYDAIKSSTFQTDGFAVIVNHQIIAECEDSEVADWICQQWNTRVAPAPDPGEYPGVAARITKDEICDLIDQAYIPTTINQLAGFIHRLNRDWWVDIHTGAPLERDFAGLMMMAVTELAEAVEGHRKNLMDDKLPHRQMVEVEIADALIRLLDSCAGLKLDVGGAMLEKLRFNVRREDHSIAHRLSDHGKKY